MQKTSLCVRTRVHLRLTRIVGVRMSNRHEPIVNGIRGLRDPDL